jgi:hypothetical protein
MTDKYRTQPEIIKMLRREGFGPRMAKVGSAIALTETPVEGAPEPMADFGMIGDLNLVDAKWDASYGGFQIRGLKVQRGTGDFRDADQLLHPRFNCQSTRIIYLDQGWQAWSTFNSGRYKAFLQDWYPPPAYTHIVMPNENLSTIAPLYGVTWQDLARWNGLHDPYTIGIGDHILYVDPTM